jgi:hypothetical protein
LPQLTLLQYLMHPVHKGPGFQRPYPGSLALQRRRGACREWAYAFSFIPTLVQLYHARYVLQVNSRATGQANPANKGEVRTSSLNNVATRRATRRRYCHRCTDDASAAVETYRDSVDDFVARAVVRQENNSRAGPAGALCRGPAHQ